MYRLLVREIAQQKKMSQARLSREANVAMKTMQEIYEEPHKNVELRTLEKIARALQVPIKDLFAEDEAEAPETRTRL